MCNQENRNKISTEMSLTGEGMERREANTSIDLTKVHKMLMLNESSNYL